MLDILFEHTEFEWDGANLDKSWKKHGIQPLEAEEIFSNDPLLISTDTKLPGEENRYIALGQTDHNKLLFIAFTMRNKRIRIISARSMSKKERKIYEEVKKDS